MEISTFIAHFVFIGGTFAGGMAVGYKYRNYIESLVKKYLKKN